MSAYTEGPVIDRHLNLFFTCPSAGEVKKMSGSGEITTWAKLRRPNGQVILGNGDHLVCDSAGAVVWRFDERGSFRKADVEKECAGFSFSTPNDLVDDGSGYYFTDSVRHRGAVYYVGYSGIQRRVACGLDYPNGIALSADGKTLFVSESYKNRIIQFALEEPGIAGGDFEIFVDLPVHASGRAYDNLPDGIKMDKDDRLWIAHYGMGNIYEVAGAGEIVRTMNAGFRCCSNIFLTEKTCVVTGGETEDGPGGVRVVRR